jgi:hypothetical protein
MGWADKTGRTQAKACGMGESPGRCLIGAVLTPKIAAVERRWARA